MEQEHKKRKKLKAVILGIGSFVLAIMLEFFEEFLTGFLDEYEVPLGMRLHQAMGLPEFTKPFMRHFFLYSVAIFVAVVLLRILWRWCRKKGWFSEKISPCEDDWMKPQAKQSKKGDGA